MPSFRTVMNAQDKYVAGHIYALEAKTVNDLYAQYERSYINLQIQLEAIARRYGTGETWSASDAAFRERTEVLVSQIMAEMKALSGQSASTTMQAAIDGYDASFYGRAWIVDTMTGGKANVPLLPAEAVRAAILAPYEGSTFVDRWKTNEDEFQRRIRQSIVQSQINGETIYQAQKRIAGELGIDIGRMGAAAKAANTANFYRTQLIARSEIIRSSNAGSLAVYRANSDVLTGWDWLTAKDDRVCDLCGPLDGTHHDMSEQFQEQHPGCRCSPTPSVKDKDIEAQIVGPRETFLDWAARKGIEQSRYGGVYAMPAQKPPKPKRAA